MKFHLLTGEDTHESTWIAKNKHAVDTAITLFAQFPHYLCYFSSSERSVLIVLVFYYKGMLGNVTIPKNPAIISFSVVTQRIHRSQNIAIECGTSFLGSAPIS